MLAKSLLRALTDSCAGPPRSPPPVVLPGPNPARLAPRRPFARHSPAKAAAHVPGRCVAAVRPPRCDPGCAECQRCALRLCSSRGVRCTRLPWRRGKQARYRPCAAAPDQRDRATGCKRRRPPKHFMLAQTPACCSGPVSFDVRLHKRTPRRSLQKFFLQYYATRNTLCT